MRAMSRGIESRRSSSWAICSTSFALKTHSIIGARKCSAWLPRKFIGPIDSKNIVAGAAMSRLTITSATRAMRSSSSLAKVIDSGWVAKAWQNPARSSASFPARFSLESNRISAGQTRETLNGSHYMNGAEESQRKGLRAPPSWLEISLCPAVHVSMTARCGNFFVACRNRVCPARYCLDSSKFAYGGTYDAVH